MEIKEEETLTPFLRGKIKIIQSKEGYRFNIDSLLLASFVKITDRPSKLIDLGTGSGIILILLSLKYKKVQLYGIELQESLFSQAWRNIHINNIKAQLFKGDVREIKRIFRSESFEYAVFNPPYHQPPLDIEKTEKNIARFEIEGKIKDFVKASSYLLKNGGKLFAIIPSSRFSEFITSLIEQNIQPKRYRTVHPTIDESATHVLLEGIKGGKSGGETVEKASYCL
ncbi:MAG: methyltransferase [Persephonella sp.]|nr:methyltransferase [Persephonella sp.]